MNKLLSDVIFQLHSFDVESVKIANIIDDFLANSIYKMLKPRLTNMDYMHIYIDLQTMIFKLSMHESVYTLPHGATRSIRNFNARFIRGAVQRIRRRDITGFIEYNFLQRVSWSPERGSEDILRKSMCYDLSRNATNYLVDYQNFINQLYNAFKEAQLF